MSNIRVTSKSTHGFEFFQTFEPESILDHHHHHRSTREFRIEKNARFNLSTCRTSVDLQLTYSTRAHFLIFELLTLKVVTNMSACNSI